MSAPSLGLPGPLPYLAAAWPGGAERSGASRAPHTPRCAPPEQRVMLGFFRRRRGVGCVRLFPLTTLQGKKRSKEVMPSAVKRLFLRFSAERTLQERAGGRTER